MIKISGINNNMVDITADFIARQNNIKSKHIGYCGTEFEEIKHSMLDDFSDLPLEESMVLAFEDDKLIGVLGFDIDSDSGCAEVWGPFVEHNDWMRIAQKLWSGASKMILDKVKDVQMFIDMENENCIEFAEALHLEKVNIGKTMIIKRDDINSLKPIELKELPPVFYDDMKKLHDSNFQDTYYSGETLINRINENRKVFIATEGNSLLGYIYIEVEPKFGEGTIHYVAVREESRGRGTGSKLLNIALNWAFSFKTIESINLWVNVKNNAEKLYEEIGFKDLSTFVFYRQKYTLNC